MRERMEESEVPRFRDGQKEGWGMKLWQFDTCGDDLGSLTEIDKLAQ